MPRICICDDDPVVAEVLGRDLAAAGFEVEEPLSSPDQAMGWLTVDPPDLLILDLNMPVGGGLDLLRWLNIEGRLGATKVLMLTGEHDTRFIRSARASGAAGHMTKPVVSAQLVANVRRLLLDDDVAWVDDQTVLSRPAPDPPPRPGQARGLEALSPMVAAFVSDYGRDAVVGLLTSLHDQLALMDEARQGRADPLSTAHAIRGAAAALGFDRTAAACGALEEACRSGLVVQGRLIQAASACAGTRAEIAACLREA